MAALPRFLTGDFTFSSLSAPDLSMCDKKQIKNYFSNSYNINESLFSCFTNENAFYKCPDSLRLPLIFYYGHTAAVYVNKMILANVIEPEERISLASETIFETGVDEMSWDDVEHNRMGNKYTWPSIREVINFRKNVRDLVLAVIDRMPLELPITFESPWWSLMMGIEHERIHIETSSVLIRQMPVNLVKRPTNWKYGPTGGNQFVKNEFIKIRGSVVTLGKSNDFPLFGWDNEYGKVQIMVPDFEISKYPVTNGEFLEFVLDGGYKQKNLWPLEGWLWVAFQKASHPTFWVCNRNCKSRCGGDLQQYSHCEPSNNGSAYRLRCIFDVIDMPLNWPVEVNYYEAKAFCSWKGKTYRLLSEAEYAELESQCYDNALANHHLIYGSSTPVDHFPPNKLGVYDIVGNVWIWLEDHFNGLPGFQSHYLYDDFSTPCFDGLHSMIAGGSWATNGVHVEKFSRFSFRRHFFQHVGFRVVKQNMENLTKLPIKLVKTTGLSITKIEYPFLNEELNKKCIHEDSKNMQFVLETPDVLRRALADESVNEINEVILQKCLEVTQKYFVQRDNLLHIGCGTGGLAFGLKNYFNRVIGVDLFQSYIGICTELMTKRGKGGNNKICFKQVTWIPNEFSHQNVVVFSMGERAANLKAWSRRMPEVVKKDGILISVARRNTGHIFKEDEATMKKFVLITDSSFEFKEEKFRFTAWKNIRL